MITVKRDLNNKEVLELRHLLTNAVDSSDYQNAFDLFVDFCGLDKGEIASMEIAQIYSQIKRNYPEFEEALAFLGRLEDEWAYTRIISSSVGRRLTERQAQGILLLALSVRALSVWLPADDDQE